MIVHCAKLSATVLCGAVIAWTGFLGPVNGQDKTPYSPPAAEQRAAEWINEQGIKAHIRFLADDLLEGRGPGSRGDALAQRYIAARFAALGFEPAAPDGTYFQPFPLVGVTTHNPTSITFRRADKSLNLSHFEEFILNAGKPLEKVELQDAELVFVGYGIEAPEYQWDDFKGQDLRGKVLVMMNNDPSDDPNLFAGKRRLYYGRWDYKYESAARQGAAGALIIHTTASAGYPYQVIQTSWSGEEFELADQPGPRLDVRGWLAEEAAKKLFSFAGFDLDQLRAQAESRDFKPVALGTKLSTVLPCTVRPQTTGNVIARLPGRDPVLKDQPLIFMAHHDHLGIGATRDARGDNIYNGAIDNASGSASLLSIAEACSRLPEPPRRSILFVAVGAEEQGLLGSLYFAANPPIAPGKMAAVINMDGMNWMGRAKDVNVIGLGKSNLDAIVQQVAGFQNRIITPDHFPDRGYYYRSDQFSLAKIGVPGVYLHSGVEIIGKPEGWGRERQTEWVEKVYHQPSDEFQESWDLSGGVEDTRLLFHVGMRVANQDALPRWEPGDEFEAARLAALKQVKAE